MTVAKIIKYVWTTSQSTNINTVQFPDKIIKIQQFDVMIFKAQFRNVNVKPLPKITQTPVIFIAFQNVLLRDFYSLALTQAVLAS